MSDRDVLAERLQDAGLLEKRLIPVKDGEKRSLVYHNDASNRESGFGSLTGNYGVYAGATPDGGRWLRNVHRRQNARRDTENVGEVGQHSRSVP
nr:hypothetical protein [Haloferax sp. BAB-2207]